MPEVVVNKAKTLFILYRKQSGITAAKAEFEWHDLSSAQRDTWRRLEKSELGLLLVDEHAESEN